MLKSISFSNESKNKIEVSQGQQKKKNSRYSKIRIQDINEEQSDYDLDTI